MRSGCLRGKRLASWWAGLLSGKNSEVNIHSGKRLAFQFVEVQQTKCTADSAWDVLIHVPELKVSLKSGNLCSYGIGGMV